MADEKSLAEELGEAIDAGSVDTVKSTPIEAAPVETAPAESTGKARDEQGKFAKSDTSASTAKAEQVHIDQQSATAPVTPAEQSPDARAMVTPPATWSAAGKAIYATLPEAARKEIAKREGDYARGIQQHAEAAKGYQNLMREFQPYEAMIRAENGTPEGAIRDLLKTAYALRTGTPQERGQLVMQVARQFGADISPFIGQQAKPEGQPEFLPQVQQYVQQLVSPHLQRIQSWEQQQAQAQQMHERQAQEEVRSHVEAFQSATAEDGITPKHVYFENVRGAMSALIAEGQAKDLEQAYDMACWANPEVRAALQADMQRSADAQRLEEAKRKANDAKNASFNVNGQGGVGISGSTQTSLRDELASQLESAMGGGRL